MRTCMLHIHCIYVLLLAAVYLSVLAVAQDGQQLQHNVLNDQTDESNGKESLKTLESQSRDKDEGDVGMEGDSTDIVEDPSIKATEDILRDLLLSAHSDKASEYEASEGGNADYADLIEDIRSQSEENDLLVVTKYGEQVRVEKIVLDLDNNEAGVDGASETSAEMVKQLLEGVLAGLNVGNEVQIREFEIDLTPGEENVVELADAVYESGGSLTLAFGGPIPLDLSDKKSKSDNEVKPTALVTDISSSIRFRIEYTANSEPEIERCGSLYTPGNLDGSRVMCCLPSQREDEQENPQTNTEPEAIIAALIGTCIDYSDGFWSYEFCIGGSLRQFLIAQQTDPETQIKHDYSLGTYTNTSVTAQASDSSTADTVEEKDTPSPNPGHAGGSSSDPPLLQWGGLRFPYFEWKYEEGTICDVTGSPRKTSVRFICMQGVPEMTMLSLQESVTCVYTAIVAVPELCTHEKFRTSSGKYYDLKCYLPDEAERFEAVRSSARRRAAAMNIPHVTNWGLPKVMPADWKDPLTVRQRGLVADEPVQYQKIRADMIMDLLKDLQAQ